MSRCLHHDHRRQHRKSGEGLDDPCGYCAASIQEGIFDPDISKLDVDAQLAVARFWSQVEVPIADDGAITIMGCWSFSDWKRLMLFGRGFSPAQLMYAFCWGDQGPWRIEHICDRDTCVNPFHMRIGEFRQPPLDMMLPWPEGFETALDRISQCNAQALTILAELDTLPATQPQRA